MDVLYFIYLDIDYFHLLDCEYYCYKHCCTNSCWSGAGAMFFRCSFADFSMQQGSDWSGGSYIVPVLSQPSLHGSWEERRLNQARLCTIRVSDGSQVMSSAASPQVGSIGVSEFLANQTPQHP